MNERDYTLLEYMSLFGGTIIILNWLLFSCAYDIPLLGMNAVFMTIIGIGTYSVSLIAYFKRRIYILEMKNLSASQKEDKQ